MDWVDKAAFGENPLYVAKTRFGEVRVRYVPKENQWFYEYTLTGRAHAPVGNDGLDAAKERALEGVRAQVRLEMESLR